MNPQADTKIVAKIFLAFLTSLFAGNIAADTAESAGATSSNEKPVENPTTKQQVTDIYNYITYSDVFSSSGQPTSEQLTHSSASGVKRVIYLAFSDQERSLSAEDRVVKQLGMSYLQIPVDWRAPKPQEYYLFAAAMQLDPKQKTLLHCQANLRASAFAFLYRVLELNVPLKEAKASMNEVWVPNGVWTQFILDILKENEVDANCSDCDWTPSTIGD